MSHLKILTLLEDPNELNQKRLHVHEKKCTGGFTYVSLHVGHYIDVFWD